MTNHILDSTRFVVEQAQLVHLNQERIQKFAENFNHSNTQHWLTAAPFQFSHLTPEQQLNFLVLFNAMSFSYWGDPKWTVEAEGQSYDGAWGLIMALGRAVKEHRPILDFTHLVHIPKEHFAHMLHGNVEIPLLEERFSIFRELGRVMTDRYQGQASQLVAQARGSVPKLVELIVEYFPSFVDKASYQGQEVFFFKRAQLLAADIVQWFKGEFIGEFAGLEKLTACADYKLPQILRKRGILEYAPSLAATVDSKTEIVAGSPEEVEIRAHTIWAVEFISREVRKRNPGVNPMEIGDHLWQTSQLKSPDDKPYHRTRTTAY